MAELTSGLVRQLVRGSNKAPIVSLYLDISSNGNKNPEGARHSFDTELRKYKRAHSSSESVTQLVADAEPLFGRIAEFLRSDQLGEQTKQTTRAIAIFASSDVWELVELPDLPDGQWKNQLHVNHAPLIRPLERALDELGSIGVLIADRQHAKFLAIGLYGIDARGALDEPLPRHDDDKGDWEKDHVRTHSAAAASAHLKHSAQAMFEFAKDHPFDRLVIAAPDDIRPELERHLHTYLKAKLVGRVNLETRSGDDKVIAAARKCASDAERSKEREAVDQLRSGNHAVSGLDGVLEAIFDHRVDTLLVSDGFETEGWRCLGCAKIAMVGPKCPKCGEKLEKVDDIVEEAVSDALSQNCKVDFCIDNADLDVAGRIGALLRF